MAPPPSSPEAGTDAPEVDPSALEYFMQQRRSEQNLPFGTAAGAVVALVSATAWAAVTFWTGFQIGWMAVAVGFLVGISIRVVGKGVDPVFGYVGASLALLGCVAGNLFAACAWFASAYDVALLDVLAGLTPALAFEMLEAGFSPMDLLFYGLAAYEGYQLSFRKIGADELREAGVIRTPPPA